MVFQCNNCGGTSIYDPAHKSMYCPYCGSENSEKLVPEKDMNLCPACGAPVQIGTHTSAGKCTSCGNYIIFDERVSGEYEPHVIMPFKITKKQALGFLKEEMKKRPFVPDDFIDESSLEHVEGLYVPFFMYDYHMHYDFQGKGNKIRTWTVGDTQYTETKTYDIRRTLEAEFDDIPVDASEAMKDDVMDLLEPFDYGALEKFQTKYMSGFFGEKYNQPAVNYLPRAKEKATNDSETMMMSTINGFSGLIPMVKDLTLTPKETRYALLPVWIYSYFYRGKLYQFHVNGQSGKFIGKMPVSVGKALGYSATVFGCVAACCMLALTALGWF